PGAPARSADARPAVASILLVLMSRSLLDGALAHLVWATLQLIDACRPLTREQLDAPVPGTYGSILETTRHLVEADTYYLAHLTSDPAREVDSGGGGPRGVGGEGGGEGR